MRAAHTPGPWSMATVPTSVGSCHKIGPFPNGAARVETYACVYADGQRIGIDDESAVSKELKANASLIAAAPDLLEALDSADRVIEVLLANMPTESRCRALEDLDNRFLPEQQLRAHRRAAIAKATGEQP